MQQAQNVVLAILQRKALRSGATVKETDDFLLQFATSALNQENPYG